MRKLLIVLFLLIPALAWAAPNTTQPNLNTLTISNCVLNGPVLGAGTGLSGLGCGTPSGNTVKFMTGSGTFAAGDCAGFDVNGNIIDNGSCTGASGGTSIADEATFTQGVTSLTPIGGFYQPNSGTTLLTAGQAGSVRMSPERFILEQKGLSTTTLAAWNSATTINTTQVILGGNFAAQSALVQLDQTSTISGGAITFEGTYDGTNWVALAANQVYDPTSTSGAAISIPYTLQATTNKPFLLFSRGFQQVRIKLSTVITGTATVTPYVTVLPYADAATLEYQINGQQKTQIVDGSGNVIASTSNNLNVQCSNCTGSGVSSTDEASFTAGASLFAPGGGFFQTTATSNALTNGQQGAFQVTAQRALFANLRNSSGTEIGTSSTPVQVTGANGTFPATESGTWTVQPGNTANSTAWLVTGTGGTFPATQSGNWTARVVGNAGGVMDAAGQNQTSPANELIIGGQFNTSPTTITSGNVSPLQLDSAGNLLVKVNSAGTLSVNLLQVGSSAVVNGGVSGSQAVGGNAANNASTSGNPVQASALAASAEPTLATNGQNASLITDLAHKLITTPYANKENVVQGAANTTGSSSTSLISTPGVGLYIYITAISCFNSSTTNTTVSLQNGSGGTTIWQGVALGPGGFTMSFPSPIGGSATNGMSSNTALFFQAGTGVSTLYCNASGYKGS